MHVDFEARKLDYIAVRESKLETERKSRQSISMRLESWRQERLVEEKEAAKRRVISEEDAALRAADVEAVRLAKKKNVREGKFEIDCRVGKSKKEINMKYKRVFIFYTLTIMALV